VTLRDRILDDILASPRRLPVVLDARPYWREMGISPACVREVVRGLLDEMRVSKRSVRVEWGATVQHDGVPR
jgi:hypothetical protein